MVRMECPCAQSKEEHSQFPHALCASNVPAFCTTNTSIQFVLEPVFVQGGLLPNMPVIRSQSTEAATGLYNFTQKEGWCTV